MTQCKQFLQPLGLFILLLLIARPVIALQTDKDQPIEVVSESSMLDRTTGTNIFYGNVKADQGTTHLTGNTITVYNNKQKQITRMIAVGDSTALAHYTTLPKPSQSIFDGKAVTITYFPQDGIANLVAQAIAFQDPNTFTGPYIIYNMEKQIVISPPSKEGQTIIVIHPDKLPH